MNVTNVPLELGPEYHSFKINYFFRLDFLPFKYTSSSMRLECLVGTV